MPRVLIVDDEPNLLLSLELLMRQAGHETRLARDGEEALRAARDWAPDLVLLDVALPLRDGFEVCQQIRADPRTSGARVVMVTAKAREVDVAKGFAVGADAYLTKPFSSRDLLARVRQLLDDGDATPA